MELAYLQKTFLKSPALLKAQPADFIVRERLGYEFTGDGEFVVLKVRKTGCNTLFVGEKLAQFAGVSPRNMSYAGLKDRHAVTEQWFCLQMPGQPTPDFSQFQLDGVEILEVARHQRKIRIGSLQGNEFEVLLRGVQPSDELENRLQTLAQQGFPNYFTEQRFGRDGHNLTQALRWARGEIKVKDRNKRSFYLSAVRSELFNQIVSARIDAGLIEQVQLGDVLQLSGSHSWFEVNEQDDLNALQQRLATGDVQLAAPLLGDEPERAGHFEKVFSAEQRELLGLLRQERIKTAYRPMLVRAQELSWQFVEDGLWLRFYLPAGSYATALVRELVDAQQPAPQTKPDNN